MAIRYRPNRKGIAALLVSPEMQDMIKDVAEAGMEYAKSISPDAAPYGEGYINSFEVESGLVEKVAGSKRATSKIKNTAPHAAAVEWKHGHRVLGRTADWIEGTGG